MKKVGPIAGLIVVLVVLGIWISRPNTITSGSNLATAQENTTTDANSEESSETTDAESTEAQSESTPEEVESTEEAVEEVLEETLSLPEGFSISASLSDEQLQVFEAADYILEPDTDYQAIIKTNRGTMIAELFEEGAPNTVNNFVFLAKHHYFDGIIFHRVLEDFMAQTGDPTGTGRGGPGYSFEDEFNDALNHSKGGMLSMANSGANTNGSQFFITFAETPWLDGRHAVFGEIIEGAEVLDTLTRIDPSNPNPSAIVNLDAPLSELKAEINIEGDDSQTVEAYLIETLGAIPDVGSRFTLGDYDAISGRVGETAAIGIFAKADYLESITIIERKTGE